MNKFVLSAKAKSDLVKIAKYTQLTWGRAQRNDYLKILDNSCELLTAKAVELPVDNRLPSFLTFL
jgi:toxin ParE1/3/4